MQSSSQLESSCFSSVEKKSTSQRNMASSPAPRNTTLSDAIITMMAVVKHSKLFDRNLIVLDAECVHSSSEQHNRRGQHCRLHVFAKQHDADMIERLYQDLQLTPKGRPTSWIKAPSSVRHRDKKQKIASSNPHNDDDHDVVEEATVFILFTTTAEKVERNRKGMKIIEVSEILGIYDAEMDEEDADILFRPPEEAILQKKIDRHVVFADWLLETYGKETLSKGTGVLDVAGGNGSLSQALVERGVPSTLVDPHPRYSKILKKMSNGGAQIHDDDKEDANLQPKLPFGVIAFPLVGDGSDLMERSEDIGHTIRNCSAIVGMHPDQATEPCVDLAIRLQVPFAVLPCCVMPTLFPFRMQKRFRQPVRSYSAFCQYLLDKKDDIDASLSSAEDQPRATWRFDSVNLPFVGRNKVIYSIIEKE